MILGAKKLVIVTASVILILQSASPAQADEIRNAEWYLTYLHVPEAQKISSGAGVVVAVIDTGVNAGQPELSGNVLAGTDEYRNFAGDGREDGDGHGTAMASLVAAHGRPGGTGALGIAPAAKILPIRAGTGGNPFPEDVRKSINWAARHGANIICIALAGAPGDQWKPVLEDTLASDVVVVAGVGNRTQGYIKVAWPAAYPGVIAAAGIDKTGKHADLSVTGPEVVLSAPAVDIVTPGRNGQYITGSGTSAATAIIAGAAALVRAKYPNLPAAEVVHRLEATATDAGPPGRDDEYGYGILNLVGALTADVPPLQASSPAQTSPAPPAADSPKKTSNLPLIGVLLAVLLAAAAVGAVITIRGRQQ